MNNRVIVASSYLIEMIIITFYRVLLNNLTNLIFFVIYIILYFHQYLCHILFKLFAVLDIKKMGVICK